MNRYQSLLGVGLLFTTLTGCSAVGKTQASRAQIATDPKDALVSITYRRDEVGHGTGFLIENKESDSCLVVTNAHVTGNHQDVRITTEKGNRLYHAESVRQFPDLDLALVSFAMDEGGCSYPVLKLGNANQVKVRDEVSVVGYPDRSENLPLVLQIYEGDVTAIEAPQAFGYGISYNAQTYKGMSGAPVLNAKGEVIAIHGMTDEGMAKLEREGSLSNTTDDDARADDELLSPSSLNWGISVQLFTKDLNALPSIAEAIDQRFASADQLIKNVHVLFALGAPEIALEVLNEAETLYPNNAELWYMKGSTLDYLKRYSEAIVAYNQAIEINRDYVDAWHDQGGTLAKMSRHDEALASYDRALELNPDYDSAWSNRGVVLVDLKRYDEALVSYDKALKINPDYDNAWYGQGVLLTILKRYDEALVSYDKALELNPDYDSAWSSRGVVLADLGHHDEALASYSKALKISPNSANTWYNQSNLFYKLGRYDEALASYDKVLEINPGDAQAWYNRGVVLTDLERPSEALVSYNKALEINPHDAQTWDNRGVELAKLKRYDEAIASHSKATDINPNLINAWINKSVALVLSGRVNQALIAVDEALQIDPNNTKAQELRETILQLQ